VCLDWVRLIDNSFYDLKEKLIVFACYKRRMIISIYTFDLSTICIYRYWRPSSRRTWLSFNTHSMCHYTSVPTATPIRRILSKPEGIWKQIILKQTESGGTVVSPRTSHSGRPGSILARGWPPWEDLQWFSFPL